MPEYRISQAEDAARLETEAEEMFAAGSEANQTSDDYILNTVILASVLFLGGLVSRFKAMAARWVIIVFSLGHVPWEWWVCVPPAAGRTAGRTRSSGRAWRSWHTVCTTS